MTDAHRTDRGFDRLVNFSDAVVAIAITLLVLPLVGLVGEAEQSTAFAIIGENGYQFMGFVLTFFVTAIYWSRHHRLFDLVRAYDYALLWLNMIWLLFVVLLPFASGLVSENGFSQGDGVVYAGVLTCLSLVQGALAVYLRRHPGLLHPDVTPADLKLAKSLVYAGFFVGIGVVSVFEPRLSAWLMLLLFPLGRLTR